MTDLALWAAEHVAVWRPPVIVLLLVMVYVCVRFAVESLEDR